MPDLANVNGVFCNLADARIPIEDRGFQFADGVYEVIVAPRGVPFLLDRHLQRLRKSADLIDLQIDAIVVDLPAMIRDGIDRAGHADTMVYVQVTRGVAARDHVHDFALTPTVVATFKPRPVYPDELRAQGAAIETTPDIRWSWCHTKSVALLPNVILKNRARQRGYFDAVVLGPDGTVRESTCANIFMVSGGVLRTPPATHDILHGITRGHLLEQAPRLDIPVEEASFTLGEMLAADEVFLTSTTMDVLPVTSVDNAIIGTGRPGPVTGQLQQCFPPNTRPAGD